MDKQHFPVIKLGHNVNRMWWSVGNPNLLCNPKAPKSLSGECFKLSVPVWSIAAYTFKPSASHQCKCSMSVKLCKINMLVKVFSGFHISYYRSEKTV